MTKSRVYNPDLVSNPSKCHLCHMSFPFKIAVYCIGTTHWIKHGGTWFEFSYVKESDEAIGGAYAPPKLVVR